MLPLLRRLFRFICPVINKGKNNSVVINSSIKSKFYVSIYGNNNTIKIDENCSLKNTSINIVGDSNVVCIGPNVRFIGPCSILMEGNSTLKIGVNTRLRGVKFVIKNGTIELGDDCMTSYGVLIRNHDSHKVFKLEDSSTQLNKPGNIFVGNHVWLCQKSTILKNVTIEDNSIVAYGAIVTKGCGPNSIIAGNPATIVKQGITWDK